MSLTHPSMSLGSRILDQVRIRGRRLIAHIGRPFFRWAFRQIVECPDLSGRRVLLVCDDYGRLANRLTRLCNLIVIAEEFEAVLIDACFTEHRNGLDAFTKSPYFVYSTASSITFTRKMRLACLIIWLCQFRERDLPKLERIETQVVETVNEQGIRRSVTLDAMRERMADRNDRFFAIFGLFYDAEPKSDEVRNRCVEAMRPSREVAARIESKFQDVLKRENTWTGLAVGVHLRQGDYRTWLGGRFYIRPEQFIDAMRAVHKNSSRDPVRFLVCSDGTIDNLQCDGLDVTFIGGSPTEDLFILSRCDLILSTFSSFAYFASFYGSVPIIDLSSRGPVTAECLDNARPILWPRLGVPESASTQS